MKESIQKVIVIGITLLLTTAFSGTLYLSYTRTTPFSEIKSQPEESSIKTNEQLLVRRAPLEQMESKYSIYTYNGITVNEYNVPKQKEILKAKKTFQMLENRSLWIGDASNIMEMQSKYLVIALEQMPIGCTSNNNQFHPSQIDQKEIDEICKNKLLDINKDYRKYGGVWVIDLETKSFTQVLQNTELQDNEIQQFGAFEKTNETTLEFLTAIRSDQQEKTEKYKLHFPQLRLEKINDTDPAT